MKPDDFDRSTCLNWTRRGEEDLYLYEMIQVSADRKHRARTWQWFRNDKLLPAHPDRRGVHHPRLEKLDRQFRAEKLTLKSSF